MQSRSVDGAGALSFFRVSKARLSFLAEADATTGATGLAGGLALPYWHPRRLLAPPRR